MKIIHMNLRQGEIKAKAENQDDLWHLSQVIEPGDIIKGRTYRKVKVGGTSGDEKSSHERKPVFLSIEAEKIEFHEYSNQLRIGGKANEGTEDVPAGSYHTFSIEPETIITIFKENWPNYMLDQLKEATKEKQPKILICVFDREDVIFALMKRSGYETLSNFSGDIDKKTYSGLQHGKGNFYSAIITQLQDYDQRLKLDTIILASPSFWKEELQKELGENELKKKIRLATCSSVTQNAIDEVLKRPEVQNILKEDRATMETEMVESLLGEISKNGKATYGLKQTEIAANSGAVEKLLVADSLIQQTRLEGKYKQIEKIMKTVEMSKGNVKIINSSHEAGKRLKGLGGIAAVLRYQLNYS